MERRLAAVMVAVVVGYARLVRADENTTIAEVKALWNEAVEPRIAANGGRVVKLMGDGVLAEFASVVDAVRASVEIQQSVEPAEDASNDRKGQPIRLRIGINLGDIVVDGTEIQGDGVNIAARLEGLALPGGICVSGAVYDQLVDRLSLEFEDMGDQEVKNIERPVRAWRWGGAKPKPFDTLVGKVRNTGAKPSIAVLPFDNMSDDVDQEYFSDGITEDLITALSRIRAFFVIARNSTFTYKGRAVAAKQVSEELGARYIVEGSVRRAANRIRITVQLIDAEHDTHLWAERYDRHIDDFFDLQDEITSIIVGSIEPQLGHAEGERARHKPFDSLAAWDCLHRAVWHVLKFTAQDFAKGIELLDKAVEIDPSFARAWGVKASAYQASVLLGFTDSPMQRIAEAVEFGRRAVALDGDDAHNHFGLGRAYTSSGDIDHAIAHFEFALDINPSFALAHYGIVTAMILAERHEQGLAHADMALGLSPRDPMLWTFLQVKAHSQYHLRRYEDAAATAQRATRHSGAEFWCWVALAAAKAQLGEQEAAIRAANVAIRLNPKLSLDFIRAALPWRSTRDLNHYLDGLQKAGLPAH